jgi:hypothetical protein
MRDISQYNKYQQFISKDDRKNQTEFFQIEKMLIVFVAVDASCWH